MLPVFFTKPFCRPFIDEVNLHRYVEVDEAVWTVSVINRRSSTMCGHSFTMNSQRGYEFPDFLLKKVNLIVYY
jgi:hypothetical protein